MTGLIIKKISAVVFFGICFGLLEAVVVLYLQQILGTGGNLMNHAVLETDIKYSLGIISFLKPEASNVVIANQKILSLEIWREAATIGMLSALGFIAGNKFKEKMAYFSLSFAIWDIFYYIFLRIFSGWPRSLFDFDVFFLIPVTWIGPVFTPVVISTILIITSVLILIHEERP